MWSFPPYLLNWVSKSFKASSKYRIRLYPTSLVPIEEFYPLLDIISKIRKKSKYLTVIVTE